jgi:hypothetical protein
MIFDKKTKKTKWSNDSLQQMVLGKLDISMKNSKIGSYTIQENLIKID